MIPPPTPAQEVFETYRKDVNFVRLLIQPAAATRNIILTLLAIFAVGFAFSGGVAARFSLPADVMDAVFVVGAKQNAGISSGELWRLVTGTLLHSGLVHLGFNLYGLYSLGGVVERLIGSRRFVVLYGLSGLGGGLASYLFSEQMSVGASGAIFGVLGAAVVFGWRRRGWIPKGVSHALSKGLLPWLVISLMVGLVPSIQIDNAAHLGGLAVGLLMGGVLGSPLSGAAPSVGKERLWGAGMWLMAALLVASLVGMGVKAVACIESEDAWKVCATPAP